MVKFILTPSQLSLVFLLLSCPDPAALVVFLVLVLQPWCCSLGLVALVLAAIGWHLLCECVVSSVCTQAYCGLFFTLLRGLSSGCSQSRGPIGGN